MKCRIEYNDGRPSVDCKSLQEAMQSLLSEYPDGVAVDAGGFQLDADTPDESYDVRSSRAALVWASDEDAGPAGSGDTGANAVAQLLVASEENG